LPNARELIKEFEERQANLPFKVWPQKTEETPEPTGILPRARKDRENGARIASKMHFRELVSPLLLSLFSY
jgi:hypothetical protein